MRATCTATTKYKKYKIVLMLTVVVGFGCLAAVNAVAVPGWGPPRTLLASDDTLGDLIEQPSVHVSLQTVYVAFKRQGLYLLRSDDYGKTWNGPFTVTETPIFNTISILENEDRLYAPDYAPAVLRTRESLELVWSEFDGENYVLRHSMSSDNGVNWEAPTTIYPTKDHAFTPRIVTIRRRHYVVWFEIQLTGVGFIGRKPITPENMALRQRTQRERLGHLTTQDMGFDLNMREELASTDFRFAVRIAELVPRTRSLKQPIARFSGDSPTVPRVFSVFVDSRDAINVVWNEGRQYRSVRTLDLGQTFEVTGLRERVEPNMLATFAYGRGGYQIAELPWSPFKDVDLVYRLVTGDQEPVLLASHITSMQTPKVDIAGPDIHLVYGSQDSRSSTITYTRTDTVPPTAQFLQPSSPDVTTPTMTVRWTGTDDYSWTDRLEYRFHNLANWLPFSPETSLSLRTMPDGTYTLQVQARDEAGNVQENPTTFEFSTNRVAPDSILTMQVPSIVQNRTLDIEWTGTDNSTPVEQLSYSWRLDGQPWSEFKPENRKTLTGLGEGRHVFEIRAQDDKGNTEENPERIEFEVRLNITMEFVTAPPELVNTDEISLEWVGRDESGDTNTTLYYSYRKDFGEWSAESIDNRIRLDGLGDGRHTIEIRARDEIGNQSAAPLKHEFRVDTTPPQTADISSVRQYTSLGYPRIALDGTDNLTPSERLRYVWSYDGNDWKPVDHPRELQVQNPIRWYSPGFEVQVAAVDEAGNQDPAPSAISYRLFDRNPAAKLYIAIAVGVVVLIVLLLLVLMFQRARARIRRRRRALERDEEFDATSPVAGMASLAEEEPAFDTTEAQALPEAAPVPVVDVEDPFATDADPFASSEELLPPPTAGSEPRSESQTTPAGKRSETEDDVFGDIPDPFASTDDQTAEETEEEDPFAPPEER